MIKQWFQNLAPREQLMVGVGGGVVLLLLLYAYIWAPVNDKIAQLQQDVVDQQATLQNLKVLQQRANELSPLTNLSNTAFSEDILQQTLQQANLPQVSFANRNEAGEYALTVKDVSFDALIQWLITLSRQYNVQVKTLSLTAGPNIGFVRGE
ncbi:MAG: type II secretion system protein M [Coxiellaceae bacterium]|nr:MAG: type II secretion system protein M [Coxiellaceae bacterium]